MKPRSPQTEIKLLRSNLSSARKRIFDLEQQLMAARKNFDAMQQRIGELLQDKELLAVAVRAAASRGEVRP